MSDRGLGESPIKKPNVLLVRPPAVFSKGRVGSVSGSPPLGIAYIAACLRKDGIPVRILDAFGEQPLRKTQYEEFDLVGLTRSEIIERIPEDVNVIGISTMFSNEWIYVKELIAEIKAKFPHVTTVLGGEHATALPEYSLWSCGSLDYVICGEGERAFQQLLDSIFSFKRDLKDVPGLAYRTRDGVVVNPKGFRLNALDELPFPAWDLVPVENYLREGLATISQKGKRVMPLLASRGCPFACKFCSNPNMWGNRYFIRDAKEVIREIKFLKKEYDITGFEFHDLTFVVKTPWIKQFCRSLVHEGLELEWNVPTTRSEAIDAEVVDLLKRSGCTNLCLSPDSGSPGQIKEILKKVDLCEVTNCAKMLLKKGIILKVNLVIGFPNERHRDIWQSIGYGLKMSLVGVNSVIFYRFVPYPGSAYFDLLEKRGMLPSYDEGFASFLISNIYNELARIRSYTPHVSDSMLKLYLFGGYALCQLVYFLRRPWQILFSVKRILKNRPESQIDLLIIGLMRRYRLLNRLLSSSE